MALNYFEMFARLRIGVDIETTTPADAVPHVLQPGYVPTYTVRNEAGDIVLEGRVDHLVDRAHGSLEALTLFEDEYPVFTVY